MNESKPIAAYREFLPIERQAELGILPEKLTIAEIAKLHPDGEAFARILLEACAVYWHHEFTRDVTAQPRYGKCKRLKKRLFSGSRPFDRNELIHEETMT